MEFSGHPLEASAAVNGVSLKRFLLTGVCVKASAERSSLLLPSFQYMAVIFHRKDLTIRETALHLCLISSCKEMLLTVSKTEKFQDDYCSYARRLFSIRNRTGRSTTAEMPKSTTNTPPSCCKGDPTLLLFFGLPRTPQNAAALMAILHPAPPLLSSWDH